MMAIEIMFLGVTVCEIFAIKICMTLILTFRNDHGQI